MRMISNKILPIFYIFCIFVLIISGYNFYKIKVEQRNRLLTIEKKLNVEEVGETIQLQLNDPTEEVTYIVENDSVVKVNEDGKLEAVGEGTCTITVVNKDNTKSQTITVNVGKTAIESYEKEEESNSSNNVNNNTVNNNSSTNSNSNSTNNTTTNKENTTTNNTTTNKNNTTTNKNNTTTNKTVNVSSVSLTASNNIIYVNSPNKSV